MKFVNLTPHRITIYASVDAPDPAVVLEPSGQVARVEFVSEEVGDQTWPFPVYADYKGDVVNLPAAADGVIYVTSKVVADAVCRFDCYSPGELRRDAAGQPIGCVGLRQSVF